jgi:hypothetical protein
VLKIDISTPDEAKCVLAEIIILKFFFLFEVRRWRIKLIPLSHQKENCVGIIWYRLSDQMQLVLGGCAIGN